MSNAVKTSTATSKNDKTEGKRRNIFDIEKCAILIMRSRQRQMTERKDLPNEEKIRTFGEKETYHYLGILKTDTIKQANVKEKYYKKCCKRTIKRLETKLYSRNLFNGEKYTRYSVVR